VSQDGRLGELLSLQEHGERIASRVLLRDLLHLDGVVREEEVEGVELITTIVAGVLPVDAERQHLSVVLKEGVQVAVVTAAAQLDLVVVLALGSVWRVLLVVDHGAGCLVRILGEGFSGSEVMSLSGIELTGEIVTVVNAEDSLVDLEVHGEREVAPVVGSGGAAVGGDLVALEEDTLGKAGVLLPVFEDVDGVVFEVVEHGALVDAVVLVAGLDNGLLEVGIEAEDLSVMLEPFRGDLWDRVILVLGARGDTGEVGGGAESHGFEERAIDGLL